MTKLLPVVAFSLLLGSWSAPARADIISFHVQLGSWNGSTFTADGSDWNTYNTENWAVGATLPGYGNPVLDGYNNVNLAPGQYYLFMADNNDTTGTAIDVTIGITGGTNISQVYTASGGGAQFHGGYTLVQGSGFTVTFVSAPQSSYEPVGEGQAYTDQNDENWVLDLTYGAASPIPEPASVFLLLTAMAGAVVLLGRFQSGVSKI